MDKHADQSDTSASSKLNISQKLEEFSEWRRERRHAFDTWQCPKVKKVGLEKVERTGGIQQHWLRDEKREALNKVGDIGIKQKPNIQVTIANE
ncbi:hypothetical protein SUGI_0232440 [Cryptomeria japonica]|nr:hypothetical protein SUGI_0232440 [Cryptomeria japonica]